MSSQPACSIALHWHAELLRRAFVRSGQARKRHPRSHSLQTSAANHDGNSAAILPEALFLKRLESPGRLYLCYGTFVAVPPFCRREIRPSYAPRNEIFAAESQHIEKRFVGFDDLAFEIPHKDPDNVGV